MHIHTHTHVCVTCHLVGSVASRAVALSAKHFAVGALEGVACVHMYMHKYVTHTHTHTHTRTHTHTHTHVCIRTR